MNALHVMIAAAALAVTAGAAQASQMVDIDCNAKTGSTVMLDAGTYTVSYAGIREGGHFDGYAAAAQGGKATAFEDEIGIKRAGDDHEVDYKVANTNSGFSSASAALAAYEDCLKNGVLKQVDGGKQTDVDTITFTMASKGAVTFTAPNSDKITGNCDNPGGVSVIVSPTPAPKPTPSPISVPEPASLVLLGAGLLGLGMVRRVRA